MSAAVTTISADVEAYSWNETDFAWNDPIIGQRKIGLFGVCDFLALVDQPLNLASLAAKHFDRGFIGTLAFASQNAALTGKSVTTHLALAGYEHHVSNFARAFAEDLSLRGAHRVSTTSVQKEYLNLATARPKMRAELSKTESLAVSDEMSRVVSFSRHWSTALAFAEFHSKTAHKHVWRALAVYDAMLRDADYVISDMMILSTPMTPKLFEEFLSHGNVPGYARWRDFVPGDYEYQEAMFRAVLESKNADRGLLQAMQVTVDVPDLIDRGTAHVVSGPDGVRVNFGRRFHIIPEMTLAVRGGLGDAAITPKITDLDKTGFTAILQNSDDQRVTGSFSWAAHGY